MHIEMMLEPKQTLEPLGLRWPPFHFLQTNEGLSMSEKLSAARAALVAVVRQYAPVHVAVSADAEKRLNQAMDDLQRAAVEAAHVPAAPPLPPGAQAPSPKAPKAAATPTPPPAPATAKPAAAAPKPTEGTVQEEDEKLA